MKRFTFKRLILLLVFTWIITVIITGCSGTITANHVESSIPATDTSTPANYGENDNGFIGYRQIDGKWYGIVTENKRVEFNALIDKYRIQFKSDHPGIWLEHDVGINTWTDPFGNHLWAVDLTTLGYYMNLEQWKRDKRSEDNLWIKTLNIL